MIQFVAMGVPGDVFKHFIIGIVLTAVRRNLWTNATAIIVIRCMHDDGSDKEYFLLLYCDWMSVITPVDG